MLYVTTRNEREQFPALRTLGQNRGPDGGFYAPFRISPMSREEIESLKEKSFGTCVVFALEKLFFPKLDGVDYSVKLAQILQHNDVRSITVVRMEVPCCGGIEFAVKKALQQSGKFIPWQVVTISTEGNILE